MFRLILEAVSNPGRTVDINEYADRLYGEYPVLLAVAMTLLDNEVGFDTCGDYPLANEIASLTLAKIDEPGSADFIFVCEPEQIKNAVENAKCGTPADPHRSATVVIKDDGEPSCRLTLSGPGIDGQLTVWGSQTAREAVEARDGQRYEYPQGIDLIFVSNSGGLFAVPRLTRAEVA